MGRTKLIENWPKFTYIWTKIAVSINVTFPPTLAESERNTKVFTTLLWILCSLEDDLMTKFLSCKIMFPLFGFAILTAFFLLGDLLHRFGVPIPGGVLGLIFFYLSMSTGLVKLKWVEGMASLMLRHMVLLFVPLTVGLMDMGPLLSRQALAITASLLVSLLAVLLTTGLLGRWLLPANQVTADAHAPTAEGTYALATVDAAVEARQ